MSAGQSSRGDDGSGARLRRDLSGRGFLVGTALLTLGMVLTIAGILVPALFIPGLVGVGLGLLALAIAGVVAVSVADGDESVQALPASRGRA